MRGLYVTYALRAAMFGHGYVDDYQVNRTVQLQFALRSEADAITSFSEPLLEQGTREVIVLVYHDVQGCSISQHECLVGEA
jgi:hypothetical protein